MLYLIRKSHKSHNQANEKGFLFSEFSLILFFRFLSTKNKNFEKSLNQFVEGTKYSKKQKKFGGSRSSLKKKTSPKQKSKKNDFSIFFGKSQPNRMKIGLVTNFDMLYPNLQKKLGKTVDFEKFWKKSKIDPFRNS
jgi:hypothetical protein